MNVLITGANGRLGRATCTKLHAEKISFVAVDKTSAPELTYSIEQANLLDMDTCRRLVRGVDAIAHFANHPNWYSDTPEKVYGENVTLNMNLFQAAADAGCQRIVFSSSIQLMSGQLPIRNREAQEIFLPYLPLDSDMPALPRNCLCIE